jgi:hypothetical protein
MKKIKTISFAASAILFSSALMAQEKKPPFSISGTAGVSYEYYGLRRKPTG